MLRWFRALQLVDDVKTANQHVKTRKHKIRPKILRQTNFRVAVAMTFSTLIG